MACLGGGSAELSRESLDVCTGKGRIMLSKDQDNANAVYDKHNIGEEAAK